MVAPKVAVGIVTKICAIIALQGALIGFQHSVNICSGAWLLWHVLRLPLLLLHQSYYKAVYLAHDSFISRLRLSHS